MSYTLTIEPEIVKEAESCAMRNGTTLDAMIRACLLVFVTRDGMKGGAQVCRDPASSGIKIGLMKDEVRLPDNFDEVFDSLDGVRARVLPAEYLAAISVQTGRVKDKLRVQAFLASERFDKNAFAAICSAHGLVCPVEEDLK